MRVCILVACLAMAAGCTSTTKPAELNAENSPHLTQGHIQFEDSTTDSLIDVVRVDSQRLNGGLLKVTVTLRNKTGNILFADVRTTFLDDQKHVSEQTNRESIELPAGTVTEYSSSSMNSKAADYQILIGKPSKTVINRR